MVRFRYHDLYFIQRTQVKSPVQSTRTKMVTKAALAKANEFQFFMSQLPAEVVAAHCLTINSINDPLALYLPLTYTHTHRLS